jgi:hypothetical protein
MAKSNEVMLPAEDCDVLTGLEQIARWFGLTAGQTNARIDDGDIVTFKLPGKATVYALKSENDAHWKAAAAAHRARNGGKRSNETPSEGVFEAG